MRMIPQQSHRARPQREAASGIEPLTCPRWDQCQSQGRSPTGWDGAAEPPGWGRQSREVWLGEGGAGSWAIRRCDGANISEFRLAGWESCTSGQRCLNLFTYPSALVDWGPGSQAKRICTRSWCRETDAASYSECLPPLYLCRGDKRCFA